MKQEMGVKPGSVGTSFVVVVAIVVALVIFIFATAAHCQETTTWSKWGIAPFASSQPDACKKASTAIDGFDMPDAVKEH